MQFQPGDIVARKSYGADIHFRIYSIDYEAEVAELRGVATRLLADSPLDDLVAIDDDTRDRHYAEEEELKSSSIKMITENRELKDSFFQLPGRVLHIDGDANYLRKCLRLYKELHVPVYGIHIPETKMADHVTNLLEQIQPNMLVLTGHDAYTKKNGAMIHSFESTSTSSVDDETRVLDDYRYTACYRDAVRKAREYERNREELVIFAGACQSHFETLIRAGANYASAPKRVNIHALDPVYIVQKVCYTPINEVVQLQDVLEYAISGRAGLGGIDTLGTLRIGIPKMEDGTSSGEEVTPEPEPGSGNDNNDFNET